MQPLEWEKKLLEVQYDRRVPGGSARILKGIREGIDIEFTGNRDTARFGENIPILPEHVDAVSAVIAADVAAGKKAGPFDGPPFPNIVVSPIGAVPKKNGKVRVIHHLSYPFKGDSVNASIVDESFNLSSFGQAAHEIVKAGPGCLLIKLDVEAAYKQVPVRREDWHLLGFKWQGKWYYERVLPFGLKSSCRLWDIYAAALHDFFVRMGVPVVIHYIDDFLFIVQSLDRANDLLVQALEMCVRLGIPMAADKTEGPTTCLTFLGIQLDTVAMRASLPQSKLQELQQLTSDWSEKSHASCKECESLSGKLNFAAAVVRPGRFYQRRLWDHIARLRALSPNRHKLFPITAALRGDVEWWRQFIGRWNGVSLLYEREWSNADKLELFTDACKEGYGGLCGTQWFAGTWTPEQRSAAWRAKRESMPFYELYALVAAAAAWGHLWPGRKVLFRSDCKPVVDAIRSGRSRNPDSQHLLRHLAQIAAEHQFDFGCEHIPGVTNVAADALSRYGDCPQFRAVCPQADAQATLPPLLPLLDRTEAEVGIPMSDDTPSKRSPGARGPPTKRQ
jgi:hypothetical protein